MNDIVAPLTWKMTLDSGSFDLAASRAGRTLRTLSGSFAETTAAAARTEAGMHKVSNSFRSAVVTIGALRFAFMDLDDLLLSLPKSIAKAGGEFEKMQVLMAGLSKSSDEVVARAEAVRDVMATIQLSKNAPFEVKALSDAFVKLKSGGIDAANGSLNALVNSVAKFGGDSNQLQRASVAIQQMMGKGVVSMEELRQQLGEAIPNAMELMARGMGMSMAELTKAVSKGTVSSRTAIARMFLQMEMDAQGAAERMMKTMPGALARMKTEFELFQKTVANQGFLSTLTASFGEITRAMESEAGQKFARDLGVGLREVTESLIVTARWIANNTEGIKLMAEALFALYGGSKLASMVKGLSEQREREAQKRQAEADAYNKQLDDQAARLARKANVEQRAIADLDAARSRLEQKSDEARNRALSKLDRSIASEETKLKALEARKQAIHAAGEAARVRAETSRAEDIAAAEARLAKEREKGAGLTGKLNAVRGNADSLIEAQQRAQDDRRAAAIDRLTAKQVSALDQVKALEARRDEELAQNRAQHEARLARQKEIRSQREEALNRKIAAAQERMAQLDEKRAKLIEGARSNAIARAEREGQAQRQQLEAMQRQIQEAKEGALTREQKASQVDELRRLETEKRTAHETELRRIQEVRAQRALAERAQEESIRKLSEIKPTGARDERGRFVKGTSTAEVERIKSENAARADQIAQLRRQETGHLANARALGEEAKAAAASGDALMKRATGASPNLASMEAERAAIHKQIEATDQKIRSLREMSAAQVAADGPAGQRVAALDAQIVRQRQLVDVNQASLNALRQEGAVQSQAALGASAQVAAIEREIAAKQKLVDGHAREIAALRQASTEKGTYSAATQNKIASLERDIEASNRAISTSTAELNAARNAASGHQENAKAIAAKIAEIDRNIATSRAAVGAMEQERSAVKSSTGAHREKIEALRQQRAALEENLRTTNSAITAQSGLARATANTGSAVLGFGKSLVAGVGWALAFEVAMRAVTMAFDQFTRKAREAEAAQQALNRAKNKQSVDGDSKTLEQAAKDAQTEVSQAQSQLDFLRKEIASRQRMAETGKGAKGDVMLSDQGKANNAAELKALQAQATAAEARMAKLRETADDFSRQSREAAKYVASTKIETEVSTIMADATRKLESSSEISKLGDQRRKQLDELQKATDAKDAAKVKEITASIESGTLRVAALKLEEFRAMRTQVEQANATASAEKKVALKRELDAKEESLQRAMKDANGDKIMAAKDKDKAKAAPPQSSMAAFLESRRIEVEKMAADAKVWEDGILTVAEIRQRAEREMAAMVAADEKGFRKLSAGKDKKTGKDLAPSAADQKAGVDLMVEQDTAAQVKKLRDRLIPALDALRAEEERYADVINGDALVKPSKEVKAMDKLIQELTRVKDLIETPQGAGLKKLLDETGLSFDQFVSKLRQMPADIAVLSEVDSLNKQIQALQDDQVEDVRVKEAIKTQVVIDNARRQVAARIAALQATGPLSEQQDQHIRMLHERLSQFVELQNNGLAIRTRTAVQTMASEWARGMDALDAASAGWANSFVDKLVDGTFKFKDFVTEIGKDIAKISMKNMLSDDIAGGMGSITNTIAGWFGISNKGGTGTKGFDPALNAQRVTVVDGALKDLGIGGDKTQAATNSLFTYLRTGWDTVYQKGAEMFESMGGMVDQLINGIRSIFSSAGGSGDGGTNWWSVIGDIANAYIGSSTGTSTGSGTTTGDFARMDRASAFALGGVMTSMGAVSLRKYANGGIANSPQLALFGEGSRPEAYVPLPDGRRIPVAMQGGKQQAQMPNVVVNVINESGQPMDAKQKGQPKFDGAQMILDVVMGAAATPGPFRDGLRNAVA